MPQKKENLPVKVDVDLQNGGTITYANEVIATIAGVAANEIDGIAGMCVSGGFSEILGRNRTITKGVKVEVGSQEAAVDLYIVVEYGQPIQKVAGEVQENVRKALESLTGLHVVRVDVHVQGVSFEKEKKATLTGIEAAQANPRLTEAEQKKEAPVPAPAPQAEEKAEEALPQEKPAEEAPAKAEEAVDPQVAEDVLNEEEAANEETLQEQAQLEGDVQEEAEAAPAPQNEAEPAPQAPELAPEEKKKSRKKAPGRRRS